MFCGLFLDSIVDMNAEVQIPLQKMLSDNING